MTSCAIIALIVGSLTSAAFVIVNLRWFNPLRPTVLHYQRLAFAQREAIAAAATVVDSLLKRTAGLMHCDACGELIEVGQEGIIRDGERGILFGHATCFPPMPGQMST